MNTINEYYIHNTNTIFINSKASKTSVPLSYR